MKIKRIILLLFLISALSSAGVFAEEVNVGLYVLNLGKFDISTGQFTADFYLSLTCDNACPEQNFEFMNGRAVPRMTDIVIDTPHEKFYRIQANLVSPVYLKQFPFDSQKMQIILEDKLFTVENISYVPVLEESGIDESIVFPGWIINNWSTEVKEHYYPVYNETYSQYIFTITISKIAFNSFVKTFLPILFIILIVMFSYIIDPDKIPVRLGIIGSSLVASVMFHISIANQIPSVGYLTFADKIMLLTYFIILASFVLNAFMLELMERKQTKFAMHLHRSTEYSVFYIVPFLYIAFFMLFL